MNEPAVQSQQRLSLRVAIVAQDEARARWVRFVQSAGHMVCGLDDAQVALCVGATVSISIPAVALGRSGSLHAGQLPTDATAAQIDAALRAVAAGLTVRVPQPAPRGFEEIPERAPAELLTPRELDVLNAIGAGMSNKAVARKLGISLHTVKFHVESLFRKLGARTRAEAVARGMERRRAETIDI